MCIGKGNKKIIKLHNIRLNVMYIMSDLVKLFITNALNDLHANGTSVACQYLSGRGT